MTSAQSHKKSRTNIWLCFACLIAGVLLMPPVFGMISGFQVQGKKDAAFWILSVTLFFVAGALLANNKREVSLTRTPLFFWLFAGFLASLLFATNSLGAGRLMPFRAIFVLLILIVITRAFYISIVKNKQTGAMKKNIAVLLFTLVFLFFVGEAVCMFIPYTIGSSASLSSSIWYEKYWRPINSMGYRDEEIAKNPAKRLLVIGDSYAAGQGIENPSNRFPDLLRAQLPQGWALHNLSRCGADTRDEWSFLASFPFSPDALILSYYPNDIEGAAAKAGHVYAPRDLAGWQEVPRFFMLNSYFINFLYALAPPGHDFGYGKYLDEIYADEKVWSLHSAELRLFTDKAKQLNIPLIVVQFPFLEHPEKSITHLARVGKLMEDEGASVIDLTSLAAETPLEDRLVNLRDAHPGEKFHAKVAAEIMQRLKEKNVLEINPAL